MIGVIVLLNILIATILDIYQKSLTDRETLLARERLFLLAKHAAIEGAFTDFLNKENTYYRIRMLSLKGVFIAFVTIFQIGFVLFLNSLGDIRALAQTPLLSLFIIFLYVFVISKYLRFVPSMH